MTQLARREKLLAGVVGGLLLIGGGKRAYDASTAAIDARSDRIASLERETSRQRLAVKRGKLDAARRARWQQQSLPARRELARSLYQSWLLARLTEAGLDEVDVSSDVARGKRDGFDRLTFRVTARGGIEPCTKFLYAFYRADHLHQLRQLTVDPDVKAKKLDLAMTVEALRLADADRTDTLSDSVSSRLAYDDVGAYVERLNGRNVFAAYVPPPPPPPPRAVVERPKPPPPPPPKPRFDAARFTFVTGIVQAGGSPQVWLHVRTSGETLKLGEGELFQIGPLEGRIVEILARQVVVAAGDERLLVNLGESLRDGTVLGDAGI